MSPTIIAKEYGQPPTTITTKTFVVPGTKGLEAHYRHVHTFGDGEYWFNVKLTVPDAGEVVAEWYGPENVARVAGHIMLSDDWYSLYDHNKQQLGGEEAVTFRAFINMTSVEPLTVKQTRDAAVLHAAWREVMSKAPWYEGGTAQFPSPEEFRHEAQWRVPGPVPRLWWSTKWLCVGSNFPSDDGAQVWMPLTHGQQGVWQGLRPRHGSECNLPDSGGLRLNVYPDCVMVLFNGACLRGADVYEALSKVPLPFNPFPDFNPPTAAKE